MKLLNLQVLFMDIVNFVNYSINTTELALSY
jgi:hypothetical protein